MPNSNAIKVTNIWKSHQNGHGSYRGSTSLLGPHHGEQFSQLWPQGLYQGSQEHTRWGCKYCTNWEYGYGTFIRIFFHFLLLTFRNKRRLFLELFSKEMANCWLDLPGNENKFIEVRVGCQIHPCVNVSKIILQSHNQYNNFLIFFLLGWRGNLR